MRVNSKEALVQQLRIIHCFRSPIGGVFRHIRDLAAQQNQAGHKVGVICESCEDGPLEQQQFSDLLPDLALGLHRIPISRQIGLGDMSAIAVTRAILRKTRPDIIHGHGAKGGTYARLANRMAGKVTPQNNRARCFYTPHGGSLHYDANSLGGRIMFTAERWQERLTSGLIFVSDYEEQTYRNKVGNPRCPHIMVHNGINKEEFAPVELRPDAADFLFIGMMRDLKGPDLFIRAMSLLNQQRHDQGLPLLRGAMVGDGPQKQDYQILVRDLGLEPHIRFYPAMPVRDALTLGRVFVLSSRAESLPYIVLEALAAERPAIATRIGGLQEIFGKDSSALCAPDAQDIAEKMHLVLSDSAAFQTMIPPHAILRQNFSTEVMSQTIEQFYRAENSSSHPL